MSLRIAVASGKGGTGKTTVAANLARVFGSPVQLVDCDVEEPNLGFFIGGASLGCETVTVPTPVVEPSLCDGCGLCAEACQFGAIAVTRSRPLVFPELCHGCGGCSRACPRGAIREAGHRIGVVESFASGSVLRLEGRLDVGRPAAPPLVRAVKQRIRPGPAILDAPPGTSCPVVATVRGSDLVVLVSEPTAFGLHDLGLAVQMVRSLGLGCGVVVNRVGLGDARVQRYCETEGLPLLAEIPDDRRVAEAYSRGELMLDAVPGYRALFEGLLARIRELCARRPFASVPAGGAA
ncbi:MAG TPA: ATP-binding protein [Vicinamibacteria bacterium]|nr:ATP-binding protein [Vicinamibacteria bacterium]